LVGHEFGIETIKEADADFVGGQTDVVADIGPRGTALVRERRG
jgi:hypothetical protein